MTEGLIASLRARANIEQASYRDTETADLMREAADRLETYRPYDSTADTLVHIRHVQDLMRLAIDNLMTRAREHDQSKLRAVEKEGWDAATPRLAGLEYGSEEYRAALREIQPLVEEHYRWNDHHPEHFERDGCRGMSLMALIEMLCDWKAASMRHDNAKGIMFSIDYNQTRFGYTLELADILRNTARELAL